MRTKVNGIILGKVPYRDRDVIVKLLLRNGKRITVLFYGGRGGGKKKKSSEVEIGHLLELEVIRKKNTGEDFYSSREWKGLWVPEKIRDNYPAFQVLCFITDILGRVTVTDDLWQEDEKGPLQHEGPFRVASNALFYLEEALKKNDFDPASHTFIFLAKLLFELGLSPNLDTCLFCEKPIESGSGEVLSFSEGGFACGKCTSTGEVVRASELLGFMRKVAKLKFSQYASLGSIPSHTVRIFFDFFCYQCPLPSNEIKTWPLGQ
jgi:DNA repair protein RecO